MRPVASYISPKATKGVESGIEGRGLVADQPIARDEVVAIKGGHIVDTDTLLTLSRRLQDSEVKIADGWHVAALDDDEYEAVMLFLNHSCDPNVGLAGNVVFVAMRDIAVGEELTTDYALFDDSDEQMTCRCGSRRCRGIVTGKDWQHTDLQERYGGYFSTYLQDKIGSLR
jgi:uncharacterized protein